MAISQYHQQYIDQSDDEIQKKADVKEAELDAIFQKVNLATTNETAKVAVLGCGDKRLIEHHHRLFSKFLNKPVDLYTFDVEIEHMQGEKNVILHDCTLPLPNPPYDITYGHVVLKFVPREKQYDLIRASYDALNPGGLAIHVLDEGDYKNGEVPLEDYKSKLRAEGINFIEVPIKYGLALVLKK